MRTIISLFFIIHCCTLQLAGQNEYLGQEAPLLHPEVFASGLISLDNRSEFGSVFSEDGSEFYFGIDTDGKSEIWLTQLSGSKWSDPVPLIADERFSYNDPFLSMDESKLYFISDKSTDHSAVAKDIDIWYVTRQIDGWSRPLNVGSLINSDKNEYYMSFTEEGTMYFSSNVGAEESQSHNFDIYYSTRKDGVFETPIQLGPGVNSDSYEADVFIAPDESYLIFCANRSDGYGRGDLYISFKNEDNGWTEAINMGPNINDKHHQLCPFVSRDGKYFFYTSKQDIYWVSSQVINEYRK